MGQPELLVYCYAGSGFAYRATNLQRLAGDPVRKVFVYGENAELLGLERDIAENCAGKVTTTFSLPVTLEVMAAGVSEGAALERVCGRSFQDRFLFVRTTEMEGAIAGDGRGC